MIFTELKGKFSLNKELDEETSKLLHGLANTRRMARDIDKLKELGFNGDYGVEGEFFVDSVVGEDIDYEEDVTILNVNIQPSTQPSLWCDWVPSEDNLSIHAPESPNFWRSQEWMNYILERILNPRGYYVSGTVELIELIDPSDEGEYLLEANDKGTFINKRRK